MPTYRNIEATYKEFVDRFDGSRGYKGYIEVTDKKGNLVYSSLCNEIRITPRRAVEDAAKQAQASECYYKRICKGCSVNVRSSL